LLNATSHSKHPALPNKLFGMSRHGRLRYQKGIVA
jgi:hypothetical protein